jgi:hypothetical protein
VSLPAYEPKDAKKKKNSRIVPDLCPRQGWCCAEGSTCQDVGCCTGANSRQCGKGCYDSSSSTCCDKVGTLCPVGATCTADGRCCNPIRAAGSGAWKEQWVCGQDICYNPEETDCCLMGGEAWLCCNKTDTSWYCPKRSTLLREPPTRPPRQIDVAKLLWAARAEGEEGGGRAVGEAGTQDKKAL